MPGIRSGSRVQTQLVDLSDIETFDDDLVKVMRLQAEKASLFQEHDKNNASHLLCAHSRFLPHGPRICQRKLGGPARRHGRHRRDEIGALSICWDAANAALRTCKLPA